jgi:hypothetical protein
MEEAAEGGAVATDALSPLPPTPSSTAAPPDLLRDAVDVGSSSTLAAEGSRLHATIEVGRER